MDIMNKKNNLQIVTITIFLLLILNGTSSAGAPGPIIYVDSMGSGNYTTIQNAVDNALPGDTIIVYPGTYNEGVDVYVANLSILSYSGNPEDTIVRHIGSGSNFFINANNVAVSGFNITGTNSTGIYLSGVSGANISNNKLSGIGCGVQMESSGNCTLVNNTVNDSAQYGFYLQSSSNCTVANNTVTNVTGNGIYALFSSRCNLIENVISNTYYEGISLSFSDSCNLNGNIISNAEDGIYLYNSASCNLARNGVSNTYDDGIYMYNSSRCNLSSNTISESAYGLYISSSSNCTLTNNTANSGMFGLCLYDVENCTLTDNIMSGNWYNFELNYHDEDIDLDNRTGNVIDTSNLVDGKAVYYFEREQNPSIGRDAGVIYCINCGNVEIKDLVLQNNTYAVLLYNTSSNIQNNSINNTMYGVGVISSRDVRISDNRLGNSGAGIVAQEAMNVTITNNTIRNSIYGVATIASENCILKRNNILNSTAPYSLYRSVNSDLVKAEESNLIKETIFTGSNLVKAVRSYGVGVYSMYSQNLSIEDNTIDQSYRGIYLEECQKSSLVRNSVRNIVDAGIYTGYSSDMDFLYNTIQNVTGELMLPAAGNFSLVGISRAYGCGIYFASSQNISLVRNSVRDIGCVGVYSEESSDVKLLYNTVQNVTGETRTYDSRDSFLAGSSLVGDRRVTGYGIYLYGVEDLKLKGNGVKDCYPVWGMYLIRPVNAALESNTLQNCQGGLIALSGENLSINDCSATNCTSGGILVINGEEGTGNGYTVSGCTVEGSYLGLMAVGDGTFTGNTLSGNSYGLILYDVNNSLICGNTFAGNSLAGIVFDPDLSEIASRIGLVRSMESPSSGNNIIYNNYFNNVNNTLFNSEANNTWNTSKAAGRSIAGGPYLGGNYWANPGGKGFSQNCTDTNRDGIADSAYEIKNGTYDNLPLTTIPPTTHRSTSNYVPSGGSSGVTGIDSAQKRVAAGSQATFSFNNPVSGVLGLSFTPQQYSGNVIVRIEVLGNGTSGQRPQGEVYQMMNILVGNERFENGNNINGASINFRVSKSWVEENKIDLSTIKINRFHDEKWDQLVTEMTYEDEEYYYFTAETPGFSRYAITGDKLNTEIITPVEEKENKKITGEEQTVDKEKRTPGFESAFMVLGILASVFFARKRIVK